MTVLEDLLCVCECMCKCEFVYYEPVAKYHYNRSCGTTFQLTDRSESMFIAAQKLIALFQQENKKDALLLAKAWHCYSAGALYLYYAMKNNSPKAIYYHKEQKRYFKEYLSSYRKQPKKIARGVLIVYFPGAAVWLKKNKR